MEKTLVIREKQQADAACAIIAQNWQAMAASGHPMAVYLVEHKDKRTQEQQGYMWLRLKEISEQAYIDGRRFEAKVWHEHFKEQYLPEIEGPSKATRKNYVKWRDAPGGKRVLIGSTTDLTTFGMSGYMTQVEADGASMGVLFSANPREYGR